LGIHEGDNY
jgi:hypothetical protein